MKHPAVTAKIQKWITDKEDGARFIAMDISKSLDVTVMEAAAVLRQKNGEDVRMIGVLPGSSTRTRLWEKM